MRFKFLRTNEQCPKVVELGRKPPKPHVASIHAFSNHSEKADATPGKERFGLECATASTSDSKLNIFTK